MIINITPEEVVESKRLRDNLDKVKTYDKFKCSNNFIGALGEIVLDRWLTEQGIEHTWLGYNCDKGGFDNPDFIINKVTIDLKTTISEVMWFQKPQHNIYIYAKVADDLSFLQVVSFITKEGLIKALEDGTASVVMGRATGKSTNATRYDYIIKPTDMVDIDYLFSSTESRTLGQQVDLKGGKDGN